MDRFTSLQRLQNSQVFFADCMLPFIAAIWTMVNTGIGIGFVASPQIAARLNGIVANDTVGLIQTLDVSLDTLFTP